MLILKNEAQFLLLIPVICTHPPNNFKIWGLLNDKKNSKIMNSSSSFFEFDILDGVIFCFWKMLKYNLHMFLSHEQNGKSQ